MESSATEITRLGPEQSPPPAPRMSRWRTAWAGIRAGVGALLGLVPHVLHHVGLLAGAAVVSGVAGNAVLYVVGVLFSVPLLNRLRHRWGTWKAPAIGLIVFSALFAFSALVVGPLFNPAPAEQPQTAQASASAATDQHEGHHS